MLFRQHDPEHEYIYLIRRGSVSLTHTPDNPDAQPVIETVDSGDIFGLTTLMSNAEYGGYIASARATTLTTVYKIKISSFLPILRDNPALQHTIRSIAYRRINKFASVNPSIDATKIKESILRFLNELSGVEQNTSIPEDKN